MDTKVEVGQENIYFEMESKQEDHDETYDDLVHDRTDNACTVSTSRCSIQSLRKVF